MNLYNTEIRQGKTSLKLIGSYREMRPRTTCELAKGNIANYSRGNGDRIPHARVNDIFFCIQCDICYLHALVAELSICYTGLGFSER